MPALTPTVTIIDRDGIGIANKMTLAQVAFGNGVHTYPSGGIPLGDIAAFGLNKAIKAAFVDQPVDGYVYKVDYSNTAALKLKIYRTSHDLKVIGGTAPDENAGLGTVASGGPKLVKTAANDQTILGADAATKGGVLPGPMVEVPTSFAPAATVVKIMFIGV